MEKVSGLKLLDKAVNYLCNEKGKIDEFKMGKVLVVANAAKDLVNCGFYVSQSLNNEKNP